jgi:hypothetical protein
MIARTEAATNSMPPPVCGSTRRRLRFDAALGNVTVDLCTPKRLASSPIRNQKETVSSLERDDRNLIDESQESTPGLDCEVTDVLTVEDVITQRFVEATQNGEIVDLLVDQSQESMPGLDCEVIDVLTVEDVITQRFVEATQNGEIVDLLSQEEYESSEFKTPLDFKSFFREADLDRRLTATTETAGFHGAYQATAVPPASAPAAPHYVYQTAVQPPSANRNPARTFTYCWSHGSTRNISHTSMSCENKSNGHQDNATAENKMNGSTKVWTAAPRSKMHKKRRTLKYGYGISRHV